MNNVTTKSGFIAKIVILATGFVVWIVSVFASPSILDGFVTIIPFFSILLLIDLPFAINIADLYLDETNGTLTARKLFKEKTLALKDIKITGYNFWPTTRGLELFTNMGNIKTHNTRKKFAFFTSFLQQKILSRGTSS